jgi:hypothetical protein
MLESIGSVKHSGKFDAILFIAASKHLGLLTSGVSNVPLFLPETATSILELLGQEDVEHWLH